MNFTHQFQHQEFQNHRCILGVKFLTTVGRIQSIFIPIQMKLKHIKSKLYYWLILILLSLSSNFMTVDQSCHFMPFEFVPLNHWLKESIFFKSHVLCLTSAFLRYFAIILLNYNARVRAQLSGCRYQMSLTVICGMAVDKVSRFLFFHFSWELARSC